MSLAVVFAAYLFLLMGIYVLFLRRILVGLDYVERMRELLEQTAVAAVSAELPMVTVLVPVRNEERMIGQVLHEILEQEYPREKLEVIVLDDDSDDGTAEIAESIAAQDPRARVLCVRKTSPGKKELLTSGVAAASGEIILTTDGDCTREPGWLRAMVATFELGYVAVCGPVLYHRGASLFSRMQALEFMSLVAVGAGFVGIGTPRLANGANLGFRKSAFESVRGYEDNRHLASGDDEFLVQRIARAYPDGVGFCPLSEGIVRTEPSRTPFAFIRQRRRWASKGMYYEDPAFVGFLVVLFVFFLSYLAAPLLLLNSPSWVLYLLFMALIKFGADWPVVLRAARMFREPIRLGDMIIAELLHAPYIVLAAALGTIPGGKWKGRSM